MALPDKYTRNKDYSQAEALNEAGRSTVDTASIDSEFDEIKTVTDQIIDNLILLLRADGNLVDNLIQSNAFSAEAISYLSAAITLGSNVTFRGDYASATTYNKHDIIYDPTGGETYICIPAGGEDSYVSDSVANDRDVTGDITYLAKSGASSVGTGTADQVLTYSGSVYVWKKLTSANVDTSSIAPIASPAFTGTVTSRNVTLGAAGSGDTITMNGKLIFDVYDYGTKATPDTTALDLSQPFMQKIAFSNASTYIPGATVGKVEGAAADIKFTGSATGDVTVTWPTGWVWLGYMPPTIKQNSTGYLSLRCYGTNESDIVASWVET